MLYSQQQALDLLKIDQSTFVYWMRAVPRIQRLKGRGCRFTTADLLALGVIAEATRGLGMSISVLAPGIPAIFDLLAFANLVDLSTQAVLIDEGNVRLHKLPVSIDGGAPTAVVPLRSTVDRIRAAELLPLERLMLARGS